MRPGRQEWERAADFFKSTAFTDDKIAAQRCMPLAERIPAAVELKEQGNKLHEQVEMGSGHAWILNLKAVVCCGHVYLNIACSLRLLYAARAVGIACV